MKKLSPTQLNALRLAAEVPSCLRVGQFNRPTEQALARRGLIYFEGRFSSGDNTSGNPSWLLTDAGRAALQSAD